MTILSAPSALTDFAALVETASRGVATSSGRVYRQTFTAWQTWAERIGLSPFDLNGPNVAQFLSDQPVSKATRQRMLSALRTLAGMLAVVDYQNPAREAAYRTLQRVKVPTENMPQTERPRRALRPAEAERALQVWDQDTRAARRNRALVAVLLLTGLRRSETVALRWGDVDLVEGVIYVRHGKGDRVRDVAIYGQAAIDALSGWQAAQGEGREYMFCAVNKGDNLGPDAPMTPTSVYRVVKATEQLARLEHFSPHDARRTLITELLATGTPLADAQAQAGHSQGQTTLRYAQAVDARQRRQAGRLRYG